MAKLKPTAERDAELFRAAGFAPDGKASGFHVSAPPSAEGSLPLAEALRRNSNSDSTAPSSSETPITVAATASPLRRIPLDQLIDSPFQPRISYPEEELLELSRTLAAVGQQQPIRVRPRADGKFELMEGHRRSRSARLLGWTDLEASVEKKTDAETRIAVWTSFDTHKGLSEWERAKMYQNAIDSGAAKTQAAVGEIFGCSQGRVSQVLSIFKLPAQILQLFEQYTVLVTSQIVLITSQLSAAHPDDGDLIANAIRRVFADGAPVESIKSWTKSQISKRTRKPTERRGIAVVAREDGSTVFNIKVSPKGEIMVSAAKELDLDPKQLCRWIVAALRERAESISKEIQ